MQKIIIKVDSGMVTAVLSSSPVKVYVLDSDIDGCEEEDLIRDTDGTQVWLDEPVTLVAPEYVRSIELRTIEEEVLK